MNTTTIYLDLETRSPVDIKLGAYRYSEESDITILAIARDDGPVLTWDESQKPNEALDLYKQAVRYGWTIVAHNAQFEYANLLNCGWLRNPSIEQMRCSAAVCRSANIPASLEKAGEYLNIDTPKNKVGMKLIRLFCLPRKDGYYNSYHTDGEVTVDGEKMTYGAAWDMFVDYCRTDVMAEREIYTKLKMFHLSDKEQAAYVFTEKMNARGVPVNLLALSRANDILNEANQRITDEFAKLTGGLAPGQRDKVLTFLKAEGYQEENLQAGTIESVLEDPGELTDKGLEVLKLKKASAYAAVKKIPAMLDRVCKDGTIKGGLVYSGASKTGRWSSRGVQFQNVKRPTVKLAEQAYEMIKARMGLDLLEETYEAPAIEILASVVRNFVEDENGFDLLDVDYSNIEGRVGAWLVGQTDMLDDMKDDVDVYKRMASSVYGTQYESVTKEQRFVGKVAVLSCIAEGELVTTNNGLKKIEKVSVDDLLWDGLDWVSHEGVIYKGRRKVISHQGLRATGCHKVYLSDGTTSQFSSAISDGQTLVETGPDKPTDWDKKNSEWQLGLRRSSSVDRVQVWFSRFSEYIKSMPSSIGLLPQVQGKKSEIKVSSMVGSKGVGSDVPLQSTDRSELQKLRCAWNRVSVFVKKGSLRVGSREHRSSERHGVGSYRQRRSLRSWKFAMGYAFRKLRQYASLQDPKLCICGNGVALCDKHGSEKTSQWFDSRSDNATSAFGGEGKAQSLEDDSETVRVYDIVNAGSRHRFTVSGYLVSNCVYQTGARKFHQTCADWGMPIDKKTAQNAVDTFRSDYPCFPEAWNAYSQAAIEAIQNPGRVTDVKYYCQNAVSVKFRYDRGGPFPMLRMKLPSGRYLVYPHPEVRRKTVKFKHLTDPTKDGEFETDAITYHGKLPHSVNYGRVATYGGDLFQSATQATARDLMVHGCLEAEKADFDIFLIVHDQALAYFGDCDKFTEALCSLPDWMDSDFPLVAEGGLVKRYSKD